MCSLFQIIVPFLIDVRAVPLPRRFHDCISRLGILVQDLAGPRQLVALWALRLGAQSTVSLVGLLALVAFLETGALSLVVRQVQPTAYCAAWLLTLSLPTL